MAVSASAEKNRIGVTAQNPRIRIPCFPRLPGYDDVENAG
jgi:hypothetical protein